MSKERDLLQYLLNSHAANGSKLDKFWKLKIEELLAQPEIISPRQRIPFYKKGYKRGYAVAVMDLKQKVESVFNLIMEEDDESDT